LGNKQGNPKSMESIEIISSEIEKIEALISKFRFLYAFPEPVFNRVELTSLAAGLLAGYPEVTFSPGPEKIYVQADAHLLEQALRNIIDNAQEAAAESVQPEVTVVLHSPAQIRIRDNGPGITEKVRTTLFDDYVTTKQQGMGLGLSFVKKVIDLHGFGIRYNSNPAGGTEVSIDAGNSGPQSGKKDG
jgi:signal transduction histidine kinase